MMLLALIGAVLLLLAGAYVLYRRYTSPEGVRWRKERVRTLIQWGPKPFLPYHITISPNPAFSIPWPGGRLRWAPHHGLQFVRWNGRGRWVVAKQLAGRSTVGGESFLPGAKKEG